MAPKQQLDKLAWQWAENTDPDTITSEHVHAAYRLGLKACKAGICRRNCKGNPHCLVNLGEKEWFTEIADSHWHNIEDPDKERRKEGEFVGLKNLGATCYVNTFLQLWFHNLHLRSVILQLREAFDEPSNSDPSTLLTAEELEKYVMSSSVAGHLQLIFAQLQYSNRRNVDPTPFINCLGLDAAQQQDAQEFSKLFMSLLEDTLSQQADVTARELVQRQFMGHYDYVTICSTCGGGSRCTSSFYELDLNIKGHKLLSECLGEFLKEEDLDGDNKYMCNNCNQKQNATRRIQLQNLPPVLNIQLLRFVFDRQTGHKKKLNTFIQFPEVLDMSQYLGQQEGSCVFDLYAVLIHRGQSAYSGHYIAHIKDQPSETWYKFNDEEIEKVGAKALHLGKEEEISEVKNGDKKPKATKGHHTSKNAYMLVYCQRANADKVYPAIPKKDALPWKVRQCLELDNLNFEEWVEEMNRLKNDSIKQGKDRQTEIQNTFAVLPVKQGQEFEWVPHKWLTRWLAAEHKDKVPLLDTTTLLCPHQRMDPDKVINAKCIDTDVADTFYATYKGKQRLKGEASLCRQCVTDRCRSIRRKTRINEDSKLIGLLLKGQSSFNSLDSGYWVGKSSLRSWKRLALEKMEADQRDRDDQCEADDENGQEPNDSNIGNNTEDSTTTVPGPSLGSTEQPAEISSKTVKFGDQEEDEALSFNEDLLCDSHGNLSVEESCRRLIPSEIWTRLKLYFPQAPEFPFDARPCEECMNEIEKEQQSKAKHKAMAMEQRALLTDLYVGRNRPIWKTDISQLYIVTTEFLDDWRKFIRDSQKNDPPCMSNSSALCPHGGFLFRPETIGHDESSQKLQYITPVEWNHLQNVTCPDVVIVVSRVEEDNGHVTFIVQPDVCQDCSLAHHEAEIQSRLCYDSATIYVRKVTSDHIMSTLDERSSTKSENTSEFEGDYESQDDESIPQGKPLKRKKATDSPPPEKICRLDPSAVGPMRRSSRHRRMRGEKELTVTCTQSLRDLKLEVMKLFSVAPFDQHLHLGGKELHGEKETLASLRILPGAVLYLKVDEPMDDPSFLEEVKEGITEEGFKGTGLLGR